MIMHHLRNTRLQRSRPREIRLRGPSHLYHNNRGPHPKQPPLSAGSSLRRKVAKKTQYKKLKAAVALDEDLDYYDIVLGNLSSKRRPGGDEGLGRSFTLVRLHGWLFRLGRQHISLNEELHANILVCHRNTGL
jgi:hypothetical protein